MHGTMSLKFIDVLTYITHPQFPAQPPVLDRLTLKMAVLHSSAVGI